MEIQIRTARGGRRVLPIVGTTLGLLLLPCASAAAKLTPQVGIGAGKPRATLGETREIGAYSTSRESPRLSSATPSLCTLSAPEIKRKQPPGHSFAVVHFNAKGTCTIIASVEATAEYEAAEARESFAVTESNGQKLAKALKVCRRATSKSKRERCETAAKKGYQERAKREEKLEEEEKASQEAEEHMKQEEELKAKREGEERRAASA